MLAFVNVFIGGDDQVYMGLLLYSLKHSLNRTLKYIECLNIMTISTILQFYFVVLYLNKCSYDKGTFIIF